MPSAQNFCGLFIVRNNKKKATAACVRPPVRAPHSLSLRLAVSRSPSLTFPFAVSLFFSLSLPLLPSKFVWPQKFLHTVNTEGIIPH